VGGEVELLLVAARVPYRAEERAERAADLHERLADPHHQHPEPEPVEQHHPDLEARCGAGRGTDTARERTDRGAERRGDRQDGGSDGEHLGDRLQHAQDGGLDVATDGFRDVLRR